MPKKPIVDAEFMQLARTRYELALAADAEDRKNAEEDVEFQDGNQWKPAVLRKRNKRKEPILTWNRLPAFVAQIVNDGRQNKPAIKITPMDGGTPQTAEFYQSRIRHLEYESDADIAYDMAREQQVVSGRGFIRITTEYKPGTFEQTVSIEPIENQFSVLFDPSARKYDRSDADWCFVFSQLSKDAYERKYGKDSAAAAANYFANESNPAPDWISVGAGGEFIQVAEYWVKEHKTRRLCLLSDITAKYRDELPDDFDESKILDERDDDVVTVCQYIIDGVEAHEETTFPVPYIPIVPVWGRQMMVKGARRNYSLVRYAKDPQRLVNLYVSNIAGEIGRMPKAVYIAAEGQLLGREEEWEEINDDPKAVVQYKAKEVGGNLVGAPRREANEPPIQALTVGLSQAIDGMKAAMGIYDSSLGAQSNETSGIAIERRKKQSNVTNFHFSDNESRSRKSVGRILLKLIPVLDKGRQQVPVRSIDGKASMVPLGTPYTDQKTGATVQHDLDQGDYDLGVSSGPSHESQREEAFDIYSQIAASDKSFMPNCGDLLFRNLDAPGADQIADRYEKMLPAPLKPPDPNGQQAAQQNAQLVQQLQAQHQQLVEHVHQLSTALETKQAEQNAKIEIARMQEETRVAIANLQEATKLALGEMAAKSQTEARASADKLAVLETQTAILDRAHEHAMAETGRAAAAATQMSGAPPDQNAAPDQGPPPDQDTPAQNAPAAAPEGQAA